MNDGIIYMQITDGLGEVCIFNDTERSQRIARVLRDNLNDPNKSLLEKAIGYCSNLVDGQIECEKVAERIKIMETRMTREEAEKILNNTKHQFRDIRGKYPYLDGLEALGLIKFDEPEKLDVKIKRIFAGRTIEGHNHLNSILDANDLKIVEK